MCGGTNDLRLRIWARGEAAATVVPPRYVDLMDSLLPISRQTKLAPYSVGAFEGECYSCISTQGSKSAPVRPLSLTSTLVLFAVEKLPDIEDMLSDRRDEIA
jgi:hypothetical protein